MGIKSFSFELSLDLITFNLHENKIFAIRFCDEIFKGKNFNDEKSEMKNDFVKNFIK